MNAISPGQIEPDPLEIDPRPRELCGRAIDQHERIDHGEGPEFYCYPDDDLVKLWELADPRDRWRHTGEAPPKVLEIPRARLEPYRTPDSTIDAFKYVASLGDADRLARWLADHPADKAELFKLWKAKRC
jgi:hypothetical protein